MSEIVTGTIFDADLPPLFEDTVRHQRVCGLLYLHDVNPGAVSLGPVEVTRDEGGKVRVKYLAVIPREGETQWGKPSGRDGNGMPLPFGQTCEHGDTPHKAVRSESFVTTWEQVAR